ncbi:hypothetical protein DER46DRAFT_581562 [Fusarium sp. MPI-SDFR-AT-0072]|uniref:Uncharacterized protein n=1 Tax=Fusarium oxysporum f. sp. rapae TaxID=485398 RepID=A0A8J5P4P1_FUSOX|nr:hypothetical protein Forpe1208_v010662 [Fusarium oxysporum f. sp. rapae]KAH7143291.1 hypothetical protein DER46DRAFT_581562 [Fusarium sp. MPI-SDFR-AT-0072]KAI7760936.1 hypothetical protein LZL87_012089 [Fusarium oxysporum]
MQFLSITSLLALATLASAKLHSQAVCVTNRRYDPIGGTPWSPSYNWKVNYEILPGATNCACNYYRNRNTGNKQWDKCPDCHFDGLVCQSKDWHIGGDEFTYYCEKKCGAQGAEAN